MEFVCGKKIFFGKKIFRQYGSETASSGTNQTYQMEIVETLEYNMFSFRLCTTNVIYSLDKENLQNNKQNDGNFLFLL